MAASPETESEETLRRLFILTGIMLCYLIDPRLIQPHFAVGVENVLLVWRGDVYGGLRFLAGAAKVDFALLRVGLIYYFLILLPEKVGFLRCADLLAMSPGAVGYHASLRIAHGFIPRNYHFADCLLHRACQFSFHIRALGNLIRAELVHKTTLPININDYLLWMRRLSCGFIFEVDAIRRNKDEGKNQRDHDVVVHAAAFVGPENIASYKFG